MDTRTVVYSPMPPDLPTERRPKTRHEVAEEYGHPWPWRKKQLVEEHAVEANVDLRDLAEVWGVTPKLLSEWVRRHGFRTENYQAKR